ncbi:MAG: hypothetical protein RQ745_12775 [Longimicrobiales bacterium]|nr:hypothetical protein [Longimicrobiales bacterium]
MLRTDTERDRLLLVTVPYYIAEPLGTDSIESALTARSAREGAVVVWERTADPASPRVCDGLRFALGRRPATLPLVVIRSPVGRFHERNGGRRGEDRIDGLWPLGVIPPAGDGGSTYIQQRLRERPRDLGQAILGLLVRRGLVIGVEALAVLERLLRRAPFIRDDRGLELHTGLARKRLEEICERAGLPGPWRWVRLRTVLDFVLFYGSGSEGRTLDDAASGTGACCSRRLVRALDELTGVEPRELRLRFGWWWVLEAWVQHEVERGGFAEMQTGRIELLGRMGIGGGVQ